MSDAGGWAEIDAWKAQHVAVVEAHIEGKKLNVEHDTHVEKHTAAVWERFKNFINRLHELPQEMLHACVMAAERRGGELRLSNSSGVAQVAMDWLEENGLGPKRPMRRRPMVPAERAMVVALAMVRMSPGSKAKGFRNQLFAEHQRGGAEITHAQAVELRRLVYTFRRQIRAEQLPEYARWLLKKSPKSARFLLP